MSSTSHQFTVRAVGDWNLEVEDGKVNRPFLKKLPENAEAAVVLTGKQNRIDICRKDERTDDKRNP